MKEKKRESLHYASLHLEWQENIEKSREPQITNIAVKKTLTGQERKKKHGVVAAAVVAMRSVENCGAK